MNTALQHGLAIPGFGKKAFERHEKLLRPHHADTTDALKQLNVEIERNVEGAENSDE